MAETITQTTILNVETSQSVKSVKDLKNQIKDLKDRIVELNNAGEDTTEEFKELGTLMRQYKDINEEAKRSSKDLGDQISTFTGSVKGVAGAISTVTGVMGLMGIESEKGTKLLKTMAAAMSITSGIQAMESGFKAVKSLIGGFAAATKGAKTMGQAIKAAFSSNPIGLLLVALTTVIGLMAKLRSEAQETAEEIKEKQEKAAEEMKDRWERAIEEVENRFSNFFNTSLDWQNFWNHEDFQNEINNISGDVGEMYLQIEKEINAFKQKADEAAANNPAWKYTKEGEEAFKNYYANLRKMAVLHYKNIETETNEEAEKVKITLQKQYASAIQEENKYNKELKKDRQKRAKDGQKTAEENAKKQLETQRKAIAEELKLQQTKTKRLYDLDVETATNKLRNGEISEKEYNDIILALEEKFFKDSTAQYENYISQMQGLREQFKNNKLISKEDINNIFPDSAFEEIQQKIDDARRKFADSQFDYNTNSKENDIAGKELQNEIDTQTKLNEIKKQSLQKRLEIESEYISESWFIKKTAAQMEQQMLQAEMENENALYNAFIEDNQNKLNLLKERYDSGLIGTQEYNAQIFALGQELIDREQEHAETAVDIKKREIENKKAIAQQYEDFERSMAGSISGILNTLADTLGESNEHYKGLKIAATLIDTLQGSIAAFTGCIQSMGMPYGAIAGALAAASTIATGMATIKKMQNVNAKSGSGASVSATATQTFTTPQTATIATGATNDYTDMMGNAVENATAKAQQTQKVVLVLNELDEAQSRKVQVTDSNTF